MPLSRAVVTGPAFMPGRTPVDASPLPSTLRLAAYGGEAEGGREESSVDHGCPVLKDGPTIAARQRGMNAPALP